jgi:hypothetical protein
METNKTKVVAVNVRQVPELTYRRFRMHCLAEGKSVQQKVIELMEAASAGTIVDRGSQFVIVPPDEQK